MKVVVSNLGVVSLLALAGCFGAARDGELPDPNQLEPLEAVNLAPSVQASGEDPFPETTTFSAGEDKDNDWYYAHVRGYVKADAVDVWAAMREVDVVVDRREVDSYEAEIDAYPEFDYSMLVSNTVHDIITVEYDRAWLHELQEGELDDPDLALVVMEKVDGTNVIKLMAGSFLIRQVEPGVTELEMIMHLDAPRVDEQTAVSYLQDVHADVVATVHGQPLQVFEKD